MNVLFRDITVYIKNLLIFLKKIIKWILILPFFVIIRPPKNIQEKTILLISMGGVGDYINLRNFIEPLKKSEKYKGYSIILLGSEVYKQLAIELDGEFIDKFIWIDRKKITCDVFYLYNKLKELRSIGYEIVIDVVNRRLSSLEPFIVKFVKAREKIGIEPLLYASDIFLYKLTKKIYTKLIPIQDGIVFDFYKNKDFFEKILDTTIDIARPTIILKKKYLRFQLPEKYALIFIGSFAKFKKWSLENYAKVAKHLKSKYGYEIVLCGGPAEVEDAKVFEKFYKGDFINLVGKISLVEFLDVLSGASLLVSNESSAVHLAIALCPEKLVFVISNGYGFGIHTPYPREIAKNYFPIYHPEIERKLDDDKFLHKTYGINSKLNVDDITVERVINKIDSVLNEMNSSISGAENGNKRGFN